MKRTSIFLGIVAALTITSCSTTRYISKDTSVANVGPVALVQPLCEQYYIGADGKTVYDAELTAESSKMIDQIVSNISPVVNTQYLIPVEYSEANKDLQRAISSISSVQVPKLSKATVPECVKDILRENGYRYGAVLFAAGLTRDRKEYRKEVGKGVAEAVLTTVLTLGMATAYSMPNKYISNIYLMIVDAEADKVLYYKKSEPGTSDPFNVETVWKQVNDLVKDIK